MNSNINLSINQPIIEISNLKTVIGEQIIHENLNLNIFQGEILAIVGGSGSGKTTLLRAILMLQPYFGSIKVLGVDTNRCDDKQKQQIRKRWGVLFQQGALFSSLTALENIMFPIREYTYLSDETIAQIAKLKLLLAGLTLKPMNQYPAQLSGGMQKRLALARSISLDPELLFLDEPTAGLDPKGASALDDLVLYLKATLGLTVVIVTHDVDTLWRVADRVAFLGEGKVLQVGKIEELYHSQIPLVKEYFNDPRSQAARNIKHKEEPDNGN